VALQAQTAHPGGVVTLGSGFSTPTGVTVDGKGNVYVADNGNSKVKEIVAVNGAIPSSPVINTLGSGFANPFTVALDATGNVVVADYGNHAVKEILAAGGYTTIRTLVSGLSFIFGTAVDSHGNVFFSEYGKNHVDEILAVNGVIPPAPKIVIIGSGFNIPAGVAVDASGNVFVGDQNNNAVKEILASSGYATTITVAATGFSVPDGVAVDGSGNVYVADDGNNAVKEILAVNGVIPASPTILPLGSGFLQPFDVAVDGSGNVYVADRGNNAVKEIQLPGANFGQVPLGTTTVAFPVVFTFDTAGTLGSYAVVTLGNAGMDYSDAGGGTCHASTVYSAGQSCTVNVKFGPLAPGSRYGAVKLLSTTGAMLATSPLQGIGVGPQATFAVTTSGVSLPSTSVNVGSGFNSPGGAAVDAKGNIFVADSFNSAVKEVMASGGWTTVNKLGGSFGFDNPNGVAIDGGGNIYVADTLNDAVEEIVAAGGYSTVKTLGSGFSTPYGVAVDGFGNVFVADYSPGAVEEMMAVNGSIPASPSIRTLASGLNGPDGLAVDGNGNVFVAVYGDGTVQEIHAVNGTIPPVIPGSPVTPGSPVITTVASGFSGPSNVSVDGAGNVYVSDTDDGKVYELVAASAYTTRNVLGGTFSAPEATAVWQNGDVIVADAGTNAVTLSDYADPPALTFPATAVGLTSSAQTVAVSNGGNASLVFPLPGSGTNPSISANFAWDSSSTCLQTTPASSKAFSLAGGKSCTMAFAFKPATTGALSGNAVLTDNNLNLPNNMQSIKLSATGTPSAALTSPASKAVLTGSKVTFTWSTATGATGYGFRLGTSVGANNLFDIGTTKNTSATVSNLPTNGQTIYARLYTMNGVSQVHTDYVFTAAIQAALTGIFPASGVRGTSVNVTLTGTNLTGITAVTAPNQPSITVSKFHAVSSTEVAATLTLAPTTTLGAHTISVATRAGTATIAFTVLGGRTASPGQLQVF
jgi:sugar lactone lactonase YvrE